MDNFEFESFFIPLYRLKELFRQGWIGKIPGTEIESVADHSFGVAFLSLLFLPIENDLRLQEKPSQVMLNKLSVLEKAIVHDIPESQYLDLDRSFDELLGKDEYSEIKKRLDTLAENKIVDNFEKFLQTFFSIRNKSIFPPMNGTESEEDKFVKLMDSFELYLQTCSYLKKGFISESMAEPFIASTKEKIKFFKSKFLIVNKLFSF